MWGLVTVTIEHVLAAFIRIFTLVLPSIGVAPGAEAELETFGLETTDRSSAFVLPRTIGIAADLPGPSAVRDGAAGHLLNDWRQWWTGAILPKRGGRRERHGSSCPVVWGSIERSWQKDP